MAPNANDRTAGRGPALPVMDITRVDPQDDGALRSWYAVQDAAWQHDHPQVPHVRYGELAPEAREQRRASREEYWLLDDDGQPAGSGRQGSSP